MAKKTVSKSISNLKKRLDKIENKLLKISIEISNTKQISNFYWSRLQSKTKKLYEQARIIFAEWDQLNIPYFYKENIRKQIKRIKTMKFKPSKEVSYLDFIKKDKNKKSVEILLMDGISSYAIGLDSGEKKFITLMRATQQLNLTEKEINKALAEGFQEQGSIYGARKKVQEKLLKDAIDGKYITVINKNGKPINYNIKSYAELIARTQIINSQSSGTVNLALEYGSDLVQVSSHNTETPYDAQFEGKIFSLSGKDKDFPAVIDLPAFHPNCKHTITVFFKEAQPKGHLDKLIDRSKGKIFTVEQLKKKEAA